MEIYWNRIISAFQQIMALVLLLNSAAFAEVFTEAPPEKFGFISPFNVRASSFVTDFTRTDLHTDLMSWAQQNAPVLLRAVELKNQYEIKKRKILPFDAIVNTAHRHRVSPRSLIAYLVAEYGSLEEYISSGAIDYLERDLTQLTELKVARTPENLVNIDIATKYAITFNQTFGRLPYQMSASAFNQVASAITLDPPAELMQLPYLQGEAWYLYGGPHQDYNLSITDTLPFNAIDMGGPWQEYPADTSDRWVAASFNGTFYSYSSCSFSIESDDGRWVLDYIHVDNLQKNWGDSVTKNEKLGIYAGTLAQAVCGGNGSSTHPHLHIGLWRYNSVSQSYEPVELNGAHFSGYKYHTTQTVAYAPSCTKSYFEKGIEKYCHTLPTTINPIPIPNPVEEVQDDILLLILPLLTNFMIPESNLRVVGI